MDYKQIQEITKSMEKLEKKREKLVLKYKEEFDKIDFELELYKEELQKLTRNQLENQ